MVKIQPDATWTNWGGTYACNPRSIEHPATEEEIAAIVKSAASAGETVKVFGAGHSFTDIALTDGRMISLDGYQKILSVDTASKQVTVQAGITLEKLNLELDAHGLALENLGDIAYQSVAGAISTATHGTGARIGNLATQVRAISMVTADGSVVTASAAEEPEVFKAAQVSLGALGVISTVTIQCVPAFTLHSVEAPKPLEECLEKLDELVDQNDHFEFFWFPHTNGVQSLTNNRTDEPIKTRGAAREYVDDILLENHAFGLLCRLGRANNSWIPGINRFTVKMLSRTEMVDHSYRVFANPRLVRFSEMEYAIPRAAVGDALRQVRAMIDRKGLHISFPVEVRFVAPDDIFLSTAHGRDTAYIAVHVFQRMPYEPYFREVEAIMNSFEGRPHWGKLHFQTAEVLRQRYPEWDRFIAVRDRLDPERRFRNAYLDRVLGD
jgi:L-gulonolactone oxidase